MNAVRVYKQINNSYKKKIIFHVGTGAGFYSEINGMLAAMLYCYVHKIKFILYADDAAFAGGNGWNEFFESFCPQNHDLLNQKYNVRNIREKHISIIGGQMLLKARNGVQYLTSDIFGKACLGEYSKECTYVKWTEFGIDGYIGNEFVKLRDVGLKYNRKTFMEIKEKIAGIHLPAQYCSVQFRGGDKTLEVVRPMDVDCVIDRMKGSGIKIKDCFIFTDDFHYVEDVKRKCPEWNVYTLTKENEHGYVNSAFQRISWSLRRKEMIKLFAMTEICLHSSLHFGCEITCVNDYIKRVKAVAEYKPIWTAEDASLRKEFIDSIKKAYN